MGKAPKNSKPTFKMDNSLVGNGMKSKDMKKSKDTVQEEEEDFNVQK